LYSLYKMKQLNKKSESEHQSLKGLFYIDNLL